MSSAARRALVDRADPALPVVAQCRLLECRARRCITSLQQSFEDDLALMRRMDELYLAWPFSGSRARMVAVLRRDGVVVNRKRVRRLMRLMGLEAVSQKPNTSAGHPRTQSVHPICCAAWRSSSQPSLVCRYNVYPDGKGLRLPGGGHGLVPPAGYLMAAVDHDGGGLLLSRPCKRRSAATGRHPVDEDPLPSGYTLYRHTRLSFGRWIARPRSRIRVHLAAPDGPRILVDRLQPHQAHQPPHPLAVHHQRLPTPRRHHPARAVRHGQADTARPSAASEPDRPR